jgi:TDG/mug DNA glycosylase family protein
MLPDLLQENLDLVICGTAVGEESAATRQYYAKPTNKFWKTLYEVGMTDIRLKPAGYRELLSYGIGLTDLVKHTAGMDKKLSASDFTAGRLQLRQKIFQYQPRYLCFNGKKAAKKFLSMKHVDYGRQPQRIGITHLFVGPSTSGAANRWWDISIWQDLAGLIRQD